MQSLKLPLIVLGWLTVFPLKASEVENRQVVMQNVTVNQKDGSGKITFVAAEIVDVLEFTETMALVQEANREQGAAWVPRKMLATVKDFQPVSAWSGAKVFQWIADGGDTEVTYSISADGTFKSIYSANLSPYTWYGRLHRKGDLLWAKPNETRHQYFNGTTIFRITPIGIPCHLSDSKSCCYHTPDTWACL